MEKNGNEETKNNDTALNVAQKTRGTAPAGRAWDPVCRPFAGGPCLFVEGDSVWKTLHQVLFGLFGCGSFVLGAAVCCLAVLYTRGEDLLPHICKLAAGAGVCQQHGHRVLRHPAAGVLSAFQMVAACYQNGINAWLSGGALGAVLGGNLLLLCGRPAANLVMAALALCASLYIFDITPAEVWQWLCNVGGGVHEKGVAVYEQNAARRAERRAAPPRRRRRKPQTRRKIPTSWKDFEDDEAETGLKAPGWLSGVLSWGHKVTKELEGEAEPEPPQDQPGLQPPGSGSGGCAPASACPGI